MPAQVLGVKPGEWILDLCAPGGKQLVANDMASQGVLVANEIDVKRCRALLHIRTPWLVIVVPMKHRSIEYITRAVCLFLLMHLVRERAFGVSHRNGSLAGIWS